MIWPRVSLREPDVGPNCDIPLVRVNKEEGCAGRAARKPNEHRLLAARSDKRLKGMSEATARVWFCSKFKRIMLGSLIL